MLESGELNRLALTIESGRNTIPWIQGVRMVRTVACFHFFSGCVSAESTAQINGTVRAQTGAVIAAAQITAKNTETGFKRGTVTDRGGAYTLPNLPVGPYRLEAGATLPHLRRNGHPRTGCRQPIINPPSRSTPAFPLFRPAKDYAAIAPFSRWIADIILISRRCT